MNARAPARPARLTIDTVEVLTTAGDQAATLVASQDLVAGPSSTTSWLLSWLGASVSGGLLIVGRQADHRIVLTLAVEPSTLGPLPILRTVGFRQGPLSGVRAAVPVDQLLDRRAVGLIRRALIGHGVRARGLMLADVAGADMAATDVSADPLAPGREGPISLRSPLVRLQDKWTASASIGGDDDWERAFLGAKQARQARRSLRNTVETWTSVSVSAPTEPGELATALSALVAAKREASVGREDASQIFAPALDRWIPLLVDEATTRGDLDVLAVTLLGRDRPLARTFGVQARGRLDGLIQVYDPDVARLGPGRLVLRELLALARHRGATTLNFGKAEGGELPLFATDRERVVDLYLPLASPDIVAAPVAARVLRAWRNRPRSAVAVPAR